MAAGRTTLMVVVRNPAFDILKSLVDLEGLLEGRKGNDLVGQGRYQNRVCAWQRLCTKC